MTTFWDPWDDAAAIAQQLTKPKAELVVVIGARAWCEKCRQLYPGFEAMAAQGSALPCVRLWLDLEEHADFLGDFVPEDLPIWLRYRAGRLVDYRVVSAIDDRGVHGDPARPEIAPPDLWEVFTAPNWAN